MNVRWILAATLAASLGGVTLEAGAGDGRQLRSSPQWRSPPPAWGNTPGPVPYGGYRGPGTQGWRDDGYPTYRRDRQRWRDTPYDRHESRHRDGWHEQGRDDWRNGRDDWRRHDWRNHDDRRHDRSPPGQGPYAPAPRYDYRERGPYDNGYRRYGD